jgi:hypothetical protein
VRSVLTMAAVVATTSILSACIGENKNQVMASCSLQYMRPDGTRGDLEFKKIGLCMKSHGFDVITECAHVLDPIGLECFEPMTLENKIRAYVE